ncbi:MAG TPA: N-methyl-L-tryptophan oxidase [Casimicrobiaceae bacterium]|nr:N-methyl-L-tryptophan oxidase [Casimicrobiaceae bacterium]
MERFETIVLGLGAMGAATAYRLARRGNRVLGIDRHSPPHVHGSTHGDTRITRLGIGEGAQYTPLAMRSHELWREMERETGATLLTTHGGLVLSSTTKSSRSHSETFFANTVAAAKQYDIPHEIMDAGEIRRRFPPFIVADDEMGYFEPSAGFVRPEACVSVQLALAQQHGAQLHRGERVTAFDASDGGVTVATDRGNYAADRLVVTAGPWLPEFVGPSIGRHLSIYRQVLCWFDIDGPVEPYLPENFPVFIWELQGKRQGIYGFPAINGARGGLKTATEQYDATTTPDAADSEVSATEIQVIHSEYVQPFLRGLRSTCVRAASCLYTVTPDFGFIIDAMPGAERVLVASPCSGHGFKHSAAIGEALAERVIDGASRLDLGAFALSRFAE